MEEPMDTIKADKNLIARCGLYCGACKRYLKGSCKGCAENVKATWCKIRTCCADHAYASCADCTAHVDVNDCGKFNNIFSKLFGLIFRSDRKACVEMVRAKGCGEYAAHMAACGQVALKKK